MVYRLSSGQPLYKTKRQVEKSEVFKNPVTYILNDEGIEIVQGEEKAQCGWKNILKVCSSKKKCADLLRKKKCICSPKRSYRRTIRYACNFSAKKYAKKESEIMIIETNSEKETFELGKKIGENAKAGQIYTLTGDLGVGKTVFTQGLAAGLGITEPVNSPTFTIVQMYEDVVCRFIILMCIASVISKRWKRSATRTVFTVRVYA